MIKHLLYNLNQQSKLLWTDQSELSRWHKLEQFASAQRLVLISRLPTR